MESAKDHLTYSQFQTLLAELRGAGSVWFPQDLILKLETLIRLAQKGYAVANPQPTPIK